MSHPLPGVDPELLKNRHPGVVELLSFFGFDHLPSYLQDVARPCCDLAFDLAAALPDGPELTVALRKLLEAKDAFVRQALVVHRNRVLGEVAAR